MDLAESITRQKGFLSLFYSCAFFRLSIFKQNLWERELYRSFAMSRDQILASLSRVSLSIVYLHIIF